MVRRLENGSAASKPNYKASVKGSAAKGGGASPIATSATPASMRGGMPMSTRAVEHVFAKTDSKSYARLASFDFEF